MFSKVFLIVHLKVMSGINRRYHTEIAKFIWQLSFFIKFRFNFRNWLQCFYQIIICLLAFFFRFGFYNILNIFQFFFTCLFFQLYCRFKTYNILNIIFNLLFSIIKVIYFVKFINDILFFNFNRLFWLKTLSA